MDGSQIFPRNILQRPAVRRIPTGPLRKEGHPRSVFNIRTATSSDARQISKLFQETYQSSSHPAAEENKLRDLLDSGRMKMQVALEHGRIIGCMAGNSLKSPGVMELGCLVIRSEQAQYRLAHHLGDELYQQVIADKDCDLITTFARSASILRLGHRHKLARLSLCGHDGAMNVANGIREYHAISLGSNPNKNLLRAQPVRFHAGIERVMACKPHVLNLPALPISAWAISSMWDTLDDQASSIELPSPTPAGTTARALQFIWDASAENRHITHQYLFALADKPDFIDGLRHLGFKATAYLPAWYALSPGGLRHDCLLMVRYEHSSPVRIDGFEKAVHAWSRRLNRTEGWHWQEANAPLNKAVG